jgi:hypothetical protein
VKKKLRNFFGVMFVACLALPVAIVLAACGERGGDGGDNNGGDPAPQFYSVSWTNPLPSGVWFDISGIFENGGSVQGGHQITAQWAYSGAENDAVVRMNGAVVSSPHVMNVNANVNFEITLQPKGAEVAGVQVTSARTALTWVGDSEQYNANVFALRGASEDVEWHSTDEAVATVDQNGLVTAVAEGTAWIWATSKFDTTKSDARQVNVTLVNFGLSVSSPIDLVRVVAPNQNVTATATMGGANLSGTVNWSTSNSAVAEMQFVTSNMGNQNRIEGRGNGTATITASFTHLGREYTADIVVNVDWAERAVVSFNSRTGSAVAPQTIIVGEHATRPQDPTRFGYTFVDWDFDFGTPITTAITINAIWELNSEYACGGEVILGTWRLVSGHNQVSVGTYMLLTADFAGAQNDYNLITDRNVGFTNNSIAVEGVHNGEEWNWDADLNAFVLRRSVFNNQTHAATGTPAANAALSQIVPTLSADGNTMTFTTGTVFVHSSSGREYASGSAQYVWVRVDISETPWG